MKEINQELLKHPTPRFKLFEPSKEKVQKVAQTFMDNYLYVSDEYRKWDVVYGIINRYFTGQGINLVYELDDFKGLVSFNDIVPGWRCYVMLKLFGIDDDPENWRKIFNKSFIRESRVLLDTIKEEFGLKRMAAETPDPRIKKIAEMAGFKEEGRQPYAFMWNGEFHENILLSRCEDTSQEKVED